MINIFKRKIMVLLYYRQSYSTTISLFIPERTTLEFV